ncbi:MAG: hypothetical protein JSW25_01010 [Thermoplasmata archaeon]|nr:MAG: hypothetical protein JSW25_01010 [Thermoplasmata archaeon]
MAKKVRKDGERKEEKKVTFEPPEFDEREYLTEQMHNIRSNLFFIILAIPMGTAWAYTAIATESNLAGLTVSILGYILGVQFLKYVLKEDLLEGPRRLLATTFLMYLFTSLAFSVVMSNAPANDVTPPSITDVVVLHEGEGADGDGWVLLMRHRRTLELNKTNADRKEANPDQRLFTVMDGEYALEGDNLSIMIRAGDASGLDTVIMYWGYQEINETPYQMIRVSETRWQELGMDRDYYLWGEHYYEHVIEDVVEGNIWFEIVVTDNAGHDGSFETAILEDSVRIRTS